MEALEIDRVALEDVCNVLESMTEVLYARHRVYSSIELDVGTYSNSDTLTVYSIYVADVTEGSERFETWDKLFARYQELVAP